MKTRSIFTLEQLMKSRPSLQLDALNDFTLRISTSDDWPQSTV